MLWQHQAWAVAMAVGTEQIFAARLGGKTTHVPLPGLGSTEVSPHKACPPNYQKQVDSNTFRISEPRESAPSLLPQRTSHAGWTHQLHQSSAVSTEGKAPCPQKAVGGEGSRLCDTSSGEQRLDPHLDSPIRDLGHIPTHMPLIPLAPAATHTPCLQSCIKD